MKDLNNRWKKLVLSGVILIIVYKLFNNFEDIKIAFAKIFDILFPIILASIFAFFLAKPAGKIAKVISKIKIKIIKEHALAIGIVLLYLFIFLILGLIIRFITPRVYKNIEEFAKNIPLYYEMIVDFINNNTFLSKLNLLEIEPKKFVQLLDPTQINKYIGIISKIANSFLTFFLSVILSIYMIIEKRNIAIFARRFAARIFPEKTNKIIFGYARKTIDRVYSYFTGLSLDAVVVGFVNLIVFLIFKVPYAFLFSLVIGIGNLVPFFGPLVANAIVFLFTTITLGPLKAVSIIIFQIIFGQIDGNIIQPKILSNSTGISPLLVLIAVVICGDLFGFVGMILGVPIFAVFKDFISDYVEDGKINNI